MRQSRPVRAALIGTGTGLLCLFVVAVWVQPVPFTWLDPEAWPSRPIPAVMALGPYALALLGAAWGRVYPALCCAGVVALLGGFNLVRAVMLASDLGLFPWMPAAETGGDATDRLVDAMAAVGLLFSAALIPQLVAAGSARRVSVLGSGASLVLAIAVVLFLDGMTGLRPAESRTAVGGMELLSASAFALVGGNALYLAVRASRRMRRSEPWVWPPVALVLSALVLSGFLCQSLADDQTRYVSRVINTNAYALAREMDERYKDRIFGVITAVRRLERDEFATGEQWIAQAGSAIFQEGYRGLAWLGPDLAPRLFLGREENAHWIQPWLIRHRMPPHRLERAVRLRIHAVSEPLRLDEREMGYYLFMPAFRDDELLGFLVAAYAVDNTLASPVASIVERGAVVQVLDGDRVLLQIGTVPADPVGKGFGAIVDGVGPGWSVALIPTRQLVDEYRNALPETVFGLGTGLALLAAFLMRTRQQLAGSHRLVRELNAGLERKVRERTDALIHEVSERERYAANLAHAAKHDALTGLPNRDLFEEHLVRAMSNARRRAGVLAVMFVDLDNFKDVNDSLGHASGDTLLRQVADRMRATLRESDVVARQSGDEFLVLVDALSEPAAAGVLAAKVIQTLSGAFRVGDRRVHVSASIGISYFPDGDGDRVDASTLIMNADTAMYQAKHNGKNRFEFHSPALQERVRRRLDIKASLIQALERKELAVHYQPRVDLRTECAVGAEALVRWRRPGVGEIAPSEFIPIAEETGLITAVGREVLGQVCAELGYWLWTGEPVPVISVNASEHQFRDGALLRDVKHCTAADPRLNRYLELELTERVLIENRPEYRRLLQELSAMGIRVAIDDFGTGCASFSYFRNFPIDVVKIDQSFVEHVVDSTHDAMITQTIIDLARNFRLRVTAEGVETRAQCDRLRTAGCHEGQGYLFGHPMTAAAFHAYWRDTRAPA